MKIKTIIITMETVWQIVADNTNESQIYKLTKLYLLFNLGVLGFWGFGEIGRAHV